jgi:hypothetical protein
MLEEEENNEERSSTRRRREKRSRCMIREGTLDEKEREIEKLEEM